MTVGVLLVTHETIGESMLQTTINILGLCPLATKALCVSFNINPEQIESDVRQCIKELDSGDGVMILTDLYGASPSNIAHRLSDNDRIMVVAGLNLPMLMRVMNYPSLDIQQLVDKAISGGRQGIILNRRKA